MSKVNGSGSLSFPQGAQPDIIRANQKDIYYQSILQEQLTSVVQQFLGTRWQHVWQKEITTFSNVFYFSLTTLLGSQTLGEEYCDIVQIDSGGQTYPGVVRRLALVFIQTIFPYLYTRTLNEIKKKARQETDRERQGRKERWLAWLTLPKTLIGHIQPLHLAIFYFFGTYYNLSKRVTGIRYIFTRQLGPHEQRAGYEVLGMLIMIQLGIQGFIQLRRKIPQWIPHEPEEIPEKITEEEVVDQEDFDFMDDLDTEKVEWTEEESQRLKCALCLEPRTRTTSTPCGHLFCWHCIIEWCENKSECPLCRSHVNISHVVPLYNF